MGTVPGPGGPQPSNGRAPKREGPRRRFTPLTQADKDAIRAVTFCFCGRRMVNGACKTGKH